MLLCFMMCIRCICFAQQNRLMIKTNNKNSIARTMSPNQFDLLSFLIALWLLNITMNFPFVRGSSFFSFTLSLCDSQIERFSVSNIDITYRMFSMKFHKLRKFFKKYAECGNLKSCYSIRPENINLRSIQNYPVVSTSVHQFKLDKLSVYRYHLIL